MHSTTRYMYLEHGCTRFCAGGGRWPGRRNEKGPKYVPNKETRYKMRAHAQRWYRTVVPAAPGQAWGTTWPGPTDTNPPGTIWGRPGAVTGHYEYNNNDNLQKPHASGSGDRPYRERDSRRSQRPPARPAPAPLAAAAIVAIPAVERAAVAALAALSVAPVHAERPVSIGQHGQGGADRGRVRGIGAAAHLRRPAESSPTSAQWAEAGGRPPPYAKTALGSDARHQETRQSTNG